MPGERSRGPVLLLLLAVLGVVAIVAAPFVMSSYVTQSESSATQSNNPQGDTAVVPAETPSPGDDGATVEGVVPPQVTESVVPAPTGTPGARRSPNRRSTASATPSASRSTPGGQAEEPVLVLNNSRVTGLGERTAARVRSVGWPVAKVGNLRGRTAKSTVYYAPGYQAQAIDLAQRLPGDQRVHAKYDGLPGGAALTLVVTED